MNFNDPTGLLVNSVTSDGPVTFTVATWTPTSGIEGDVLIAQLNRVERQPRVPRMTSVEIAEEALDRVKADIQRATEGSVFTAEMLDCISGIETGRTWNPNVSGNRVGLFQFNESNWRASGTSIAWNGGAAARDPYTSATIAVGLLYRKLGYDGVADPTPEAVEKAIDNFGEGDGWYGKSVVECARQLERGNFAGALGVLRQYADWVRQGRP